MKRALELGVHWIDTAAIYGLGHSEEVVGRLLRELRPADRPLIFTKCGLVWDENDRMKDAKRILAPASIRKECDASLRRLGIDRIDLYQFHWADESGVAIEDSWAEMLKLVDEGKVRAAGVSNFGMELLARCEKIRHVDSLQPPFSLIRRDAGGSLIPRCAARQTGVIVYSPMQAGILNDSFSLERIARMAPDDWRRKTKEFNPPNINNNIALRDALKPIAERQGTTVAAIAVAWTLSWPGVSGAICGARSPDQVNGWVGAAKVTLTAEDLTQIATAVQRTGAGTGPSAP